MARCGGLSPFVGPGLTPWQEGTLVGATGLPLTSIERRSWLLHHLYPSAPVANIARVIDFEGPMRAPG
jgi:hypothetical protein